jgi:hypothetical protein
MAWTTLVTVHIDLIVQTVHIAQNAHGNAPNSLNNLSARVYPPAR